MIDWTHWHNEPFLIGGLIVLGWLYAILAGPLRERLTALSPQSSSPNSQLSSLSSQLSAPPSSSPNSQLSTLSSQLSAPPSSSPNSQLSTLSSQLSAPPPYPRAHAIKFYSALALFYLAVGSPLDQIGERFLFSAHMLQHQIMIYPAAILFLLGLPDWMLRPVTRQPALRGVLRLASRPLICGLVFTIVISCWHLPFAYDYALQHKTVHILEHFSFFGAALFYWWPLYSPSKDFPSASYAGQMIYLVAVVIGMTPVFAYLVFSSDILYPTYEYAPRLTWMTPADDQLLAGSMMKLVGFMVAMTAFGVSFYRWNRATERAEGQVNV